VEKPFRVMFGSKSCSFVFLTSFGKQIFQAVVPYLNKPENLPIIVPVDLVYKLHCASSF